MTIRQTLLRACLPFAAILPLATPAPAFAETAEVAAPAPAVPLWKVQDEDTTVYLFGTVHLLTAETSWFDARVAAALASADELVTELPANATTDPATPQLIASRGMLPAGTTLRSLLDDSQRTTYDAALGKLGLPVESFDQMEPWLAGMTMTVLPLMKAGYSGANGVETTLEAKAPAGAKRGAVETMEGQIALFDGLPQADQIALLVTGARDVDKTVPGLAKMVAAWQAGDADELARLMNEGFADSGLQEQLLYARNRNWADWVETRMAAPGTVFLAVGAGHLAGKNSLNAYLESEGLTVTRIR